MSYAENITQNAHTLSTPPRAQRELRWERDDRKSCPRDIGNLGFECGGQDGGLFGVRAARDIAEQPGVRGWIFGRWPYSSYVPLLLRLLRLDLTYLSINDNFEPFKSRNIVGERLVENILKHSSTLNSPSTNMAIPRHIAPFEMIKLPKPRIVHKQTADADQRTRVNCFHPVSSNFSLYCESISTMLLTLDYPSHPSPSHPLCFLRYHHRRKRRHQCLSIQQDTHVRTPKQIQHPPNDAWHIFSPTTNSKYKTSTYHNTRVNERCNQWTYWTTFLQTWYRDWQQSFQSSRIVLGLCYLFRPTLCNHRKIATVPSAVYGSRQKMTDPFHLSQCIIFRWLSRSPSCFDTWRRIENFKEDVSNNAIYLAIEHHMYILGDRHEPSYHWFESNFTSLNCKSPLRICNEEYPPTNSESRSNEEDRALSPFRWRPFSK